MSQPNAALATSGCSASCVERMASLSNELSQTKSELAKVVKQQAEDANSEGRENLSEGEDAERSHTNSDARSHSWESEVLSDDGAPPLLSAVSTTTPSGPSKSCWNQNARAHLKNSTTTTQKHDPKEDSKQSKGADNTAQRAAVHSEGLLGTASTAAKGPSAHSANSVKPPDSSASAASNKPLAEIPPLQGGPFEGNSKPTADPVRTSTTSTEQPPNGSASAVSNKPPTEPPPLQGGPFEANSKPTADRVRMFAANTEQPPNGTAPAASNKPPTEPPPLQGGLFAPTSKPSVDVLAQASPAANTIQSPIRSMLAASNEPAAKDLPPKSGPHGASSTPTEVPAPTSRTTNTVQPPSGHQNTNGDRRMQKPLLDIFDGDQGASKATCTKTVRDAPSENSKTNEFQHQLAATTGDSVEAANELKKGSNTATANQPPTESVAPVESERASGAEGSTRSTHRYKEILQKKKGASKTSSESTPLPPVDSAQPTEAPAMSPIETEMNEQQSELVSRSRTISVLREKTSLADDRRGSSCATPRSGQEDWPAVSRRKNRLEIDEANNQLSALQASKFQLSSQLESLKRQHNEQVKQNQEALRELDREYGSKQQELEAKYLEKEAEYRRLTLEHEAELKSLNQRLQQGRTQLHEAQLKEVDEKLLERLDKLDRQIEEGEAALQAQEAKLRKLKIKEASALKKMAGYALMTEELQSDQKKFMQQKSTFLLYLTAQCSYLKMREQEVVKRTRAIDQRKAEMDATYDYIVQEMTACEDRYRKLTDELKTKYDRIDEKQQKQQQHLNKEACRARSLGGMLAYSKRVSQLEYLRLNELRQRELTALEQEKTKMRKEQLKVEEDLRVREQIVKAREEEFNGTKTVVEKSRQELKSLKVEVSKQLSDLRLDYKQSYDRLVEYANAVVTRKDESVKLEKHEKVMSDTFLSLWTTCQKLFKHSKCIHMLHNTPIAQLPTNPCDYMSLDIPAPLLKSFSADMRLLKIDDMVVKFAENLPVVVQTFLDVASVLKTDEKLADRTMTEALKSLKTQLEMKRKEVAQAKAEQEEISKKLESQRKQRDQLEKEVHSAQESLDKIKEATEDANKRKESAIEALNSVTAEKGRWELSSRKLHEECAKLEEQRNDLESEVHKWQSRKTELQREYEDVTRKLAAAQREKVDTEASMATIKAKKAELLDQLSAKDKQLNLLKERLEYCNDFDVYDRDIANKKTQLKQLEAHIQRQMSLFTALEGQLERARDALKATNNDCRTNTH